MIQHCRYNLLKRNIDLIRNFNNVRELSAGVEVWSGFNEWRNKKQDLRLRFGEKGINLIHKVYNTKLNQALKKIAINLKILIFRVH